VVSFLFSLCVLGAVSYNVLGGTRFFQTRPYKVSQLSADARTVAAALCYLLEPEPDVDSVLPAQRNVADFFANNRNKTGGRYSSIKSTT